MGSNRFVANEVGKFLKFGVFLGVLIEESLKESPWVIEEL